MALQIIFYIISGLLIAAYYWCKQRYSYWQKKGIPFVEPKFLIGNLKEVFTQKQSLSLHISDLYNKPHVANAPVVGMYALHQPGLVIRDLELIKGIFIKDFNKFSNRYGKCDPNHDALGSYNLFFVRNPQWRELRNKLSPVFTSGKIKQAYGLMQEVGSNLEKHLKSNQPSSGDAYVCDIKELVSNFTTDLIATHAFGIQANSLQNPNGDFRRYGRQIFEFDFMRFLNFFVIFFMPNLSSLLHARLFSDDISKFLRDTVSYVMKERKRTGAVRNDLIDTLIALQEEANAEGNEKHFARNMDYLVAQAAVYFTAGFETASSTMSFAFHELARNPDVQERLRREINEAFIAEQGEISYEKLNSMEYLNMVLDEVLRLYPIMPFLDRVHQNPDHSEAGFSLKPHYDFELPNGTPVFIPVYAIHHDEQYWPNPEKFDPERFSIENRKTHHPMAYIPFGVGPRNCIGMRVGQLQSRLGLVHLLKNHSVRPCSKDIKDFKFDPKQPTLKFTHPIKLDVVYDGLYDKSVSK